MKKLEDIQLREDEIRNVLQRPPHILVRFGTCIICLILLLTILFCYFFKYPESISYNVYIFSERITIALSASKNGQIQLTEKAFQRNTRQGDVLAIYKNTSSLEDLNNLSSYLNQFIITDSSIYIPKKTDKSFEIGEVEQSYVNLSNAIKDYNNSIKTTSSALFRQRSHLYQSYQHLLKEIEKWKQEYLVYSPIDGIILKRMIDVNNQNVHKNDSLLVISNYSLNPTGRIYLNDSLDKRIKVGQDVNITFKDIEGKQTISKGKIKEIFKEKYNTTIILDIYLNKKEENYKTKYSQEEFSGVAEIVLPERSLFERLKSFVKE